jgi:hypothetical protein
LLASGRVSIAPVYRIAASVDGVQLRLAINGVEVGSAFNSRLTTTAFIELGFANNGSTTGKVVFSNFVFTPLS